MFGTKSKIIIPLFLIVLISISLNIYWWNHHTNSSASESQSEEIYSCPMHPQVVSDHPGDCPICGMKLVKRQKNTEANEQTDHPDMGIHLTTSQQILANVATEKPKLEKVQTAKTVVGRIIPKENSAWKVSSRAMGRIDKLYISAAGESISRGKPLYQLFSPDLANAQREYLLAKNNNDEKTRELLLSAAKNKLQSLGMESQQIRKLEQSGEISERLVFVAPQSGILMEKMINEGEWAMSGMTLMDFLDLSEVWAEGSLKEQEISEVKIGDSVEVISASNPSLRAFAKISFIAPMLDTMTRTLPFRATISNPNLAWKTESFVQIKLNKVASSEVLTIPDQAVLSTGQSNRVWVKEINGTFTPREVVVGEKQNGRVVILNGIAADYEVVVSGGYLIDSDAQLKNISMNMPGMDMGKVTEQSQMDTMKRMKMDSMPTEKQNPSAHKKSKNTEGVKMGTKNDSTKKVSEIYICPMDPEVVSDKPGKCPKCGMNLVKKQG